MIETRLFRYFLTIAHEGNFTRAAEQLFITQSTLSKQMQDLEHKLGKQLFIRGKRKISLTDEGEFFKSKAEEVLQLVEQTELAFSQGDDILAGDIYIGAAEVPSMEKIAEIIKDFQKDNPNVRFHFISGDAGQLVNYIKSGLIDFGLFLDLTIQEEFNYVALPFHHRLGVLIPEEHELAKEKSISPSQLIDYPLIVPQQFQKSTQRIELFGHLADNLKITITYSLLYNALYLAKTRAGLLLALEDMANLIETKLVFRPLVPNIDTQLYLVTKKYKQYSTATNAFLNILQNLN